MKAEKTYVITYDRKLTNLLEEIIAYKMSTKDNISQQKKIRDKIIEAINEAFKLDNETQNK